MRRLLVLVSALVFVDTMLYAALTPLIAQFAHHLHLSKSVAGTLTAAYPAGTLIGALPGGLMAVRVGPRQAVLAGLALMAAASLGFGLASSFETLFAARLFQGIASAFTWSGSFAWLLASAPTERRGELIGTAMSAAVVGALFGPVIGTAAAIGGRLPIFSALVLLAALLAVGTALLPAPPAAHSEEVPLVPAFRNSRFSGGLALLGVAALLAGIISVLGPLHLAAVGWGAVAIGAVWLVSACLEAAGAPVIGRLSDRRGALWPVRGTLVVAAGVSLALAFTGRPLLYAPLLVVASAAYGLLIVPAFALIADGADQVGLAQGLAFGLTNAAWAVGSVVGPVAAGVVASASSDRFPFVLAAVLCAAVLAVTAASLRQRSPRGLVSPGATR